MMRKPQEVKVADVCRAITDAVSERDKYRDLCVELKKLKKYATHKRNCEAININKAGKICDCGYSETIKAITKAEKILNPEQPQ